MKSDRIFWGLLLIIFGGLFLLQNLGYLSFQLGNIWRLWPLFLIYWGFSALLKQQDGSTNPVLYVIQILILGILVYFVVKPKERMANPQEGLDWQFEEEVESGEAGALRQHDFEVPLQGVERANLEIDFGAGSLTMGETTDELIAVDASTNFGNFSFEHQVKNKEADISLAHKSKNVTFKSGEFENEVNIALHQNVIWSLDIETGASECELDLSRHRVQNLDLSGGASKMSVKMGTAVGASSIRIETGASKLVLRIPERAAAKLVTETGLTDKDITGLTKQKNGTYTTDSYSENVSDRFEITISAGVASIEVKTY